MTGDALFESVRPFRWALVLSLAAVLLGQGIGIAFGVAEDAMKASLQADADAVLATAYGADAAKAKAVVDKSWIYFQRAHLHAGALGTTSLALVFLLAFLRSSPLAPRQAAAFALGVGALGYGLFWLLAGLRAPGLGSTGAAKASLFWLAWGSSGPLVLGTVATMVLLLAAILKRPPPSTRT